MSGFHCLLSVLTIDTQCLLNSKVLGSVISTFLQLNIPNNFIKTRDTFETLFDLLDAWGDAQDDSDRNDMLFKWLENYVPHWRKNDIEADMFYWILNKIPPQSLQCMDDGYLYLCIELLLDRKDEPALRFLMEHTNYRIDARSSNGKWANIHRCVVEGKKDQISVLLRLGSDLHVEGGEGCFFSPWVETPMSLTIYHPNAFLRCRELLHGVGIDLDSFLDEELQRTPWIGTCWTTKTLRQLFSKWDVNSILNWHPRRSPNGLGRLPCCDSAPRVRPIWMRFLWILRHYSPSLENTSLVYDLLHNRQSLNARIASEGKHRFPDCEFWNQNRRIMDNHSENAQFHASSEASTKVFDCPGRCHASIYHEITAEDDDMCRTCWDVWCHTGMKRLAWAPLGGRYYCHMSHYDAFKRDPFLMQRRFDARNVWDFADDKRTTSIATGSFQG